MENEKKQERNILVCPKCKKKVDQKGLRITADMECDKDWNSKPEDFVLAVRGIQAALVCKACKVMLVPDKPNIITPEKKIILAK